MTEGVPTGPEGVPTGPTGRYAEEGWTPEQRREFFNDRVRGIVLLIVVFAVVALPVVGIAYKIQVEDFAQFIAPITGIAGTIIGYWFGQHQGSS